MKTINLTSIHSDVDIIFGEYPIYKIDGFEFELYPCSYLRGYCEPIQVDFRVGVKNCKFKNVKFDTWRKVSNKIKKYINLKCNNKIIEYTEQILCDELFEVSIKFRDINLKRENYDYTN